jgi:hypothetical protein
MGLGINPVIAQTIPKEKMKVITLEYAQTLSGDTEAIKRGYVTDQVISDAQELAAEAISLPTFGKLGYLSKIGNPHQWWVDNSKVYAELVQEPRYERGKRFSIMLRIAEDISHAQKVETVISRLDSLKLMNQAETEEYILLREWLSRNQYQ